MTDMDTDHGKDWTVPQQISLVEAWHAGVAFDSAVDG